MAADVVFITTRVRMTEAAAQRYLASTRGRAGDFTDWAKVYEYAGWTVPAEADDFREESLTCGDAIRALERSSTAYRDGALCMLLETNVEDVERSPWTLAMARHLADFKDADGTDTILVHTDPDGRDCTYEELRVVFRVTKGASNAHPPATLPRREWKSLNLSFDFVTRMAFGDDVVDDDDDLVRAPRG
ncbi:MAG TPA: hypothetical protein VG389_20630 [Myxococcota bacterium]|jgi:hypothetical protein|nr:hypothetical protein [Myxococcota bacterium]